MKNKTFADELESFLNTRKKRVQKKQTANKKNNNDACRCMDITLYRKYIDNVTQSGLVSKIVSRGSRYTVYFRTGLKKEFFVSTTKSKDFFVKCFTDIMNDFKKADLSKLKEVKDCDQTVIDGDNRFFRDESLSQQVEKIDINRCYFNVAHALGLISDENYEKYQDKKYKFTVNVAVGCTDTKESVIEFDEDGKKKSYTTHKNELAKIRANILDYVAGLYREVSDMINVVYFQTDCFYIPKKDYEDKAKVENVLETIEKYGLTVKNL